MSKETPRRIAAENVTLRLRPSEGAEATHDVDVSIAYDVADRRVVEIAFVTRGKVGHGLDLMLQDLGLQLSRAIQGRDPATGDRTPLSALDLVDGLPYAVTLHPPLWAIGLRDRPELKELIAASIRAVHTMTPEQREEMWEAQRESFGRSFWDEGTRAGTRKPGTRERADVPGPPDIFPDEKGTR